MKNDQISSSAPIAVGATLKTCPLIAVLRWISPDEVEGVTEVLVESGFRLIEVPLNSPDPFKSIELIARRFGTHAVIGAGTVMKPADVARVGDVGGRLIVMPHADTGVVRAAKEQGMACFPGVATPTEGFAALEAGAVGLKVFPAESISPSVLKAWRAVFASEIPLLPTGAITPESMAGWVEAGASGFGIGGNLYKPGRTLDEIRRSANAFVRAWNSLSTSH
ncbi:2-dehydro-3-deoxy-6-phosphogalactonate aldolase [Ensifer sp. ENS07]|uniref:2-dehydro-3-deoxy-6-phosphogalactonate aldolase n=1 Tax=unclassified Ensifer TaxID=2633371 RepID=UPI001781D73A|nr:MULTISPECIES: 2-dehydro-3-deoxy-6-phosphogalactonate aldolase [unclassified Ensifer]MBD9508048.1 2-dehydro-3-deoxy-6-phosphogalactonate aldolase [Ensifer sp. ENS10]MBD9637456.1 2-dehydro-3-deoxy-6-phosphogalactonate aldolase [Ensifer sp. ENS07]